MRDHPHPLGPHAGLVAQPARPVLGQGDDRVHSVQEPAEAARQAPAEGLLEARRGP